MGVLKFGSDYDAYVAHLKACDFGSMRVCR